MIFNVPPFWPAEWGWFHQRFHIVVPGIMIPGNNRPLLMVTRPSALILFFYTNIPLHWTNTPQPHFIFKVLLYLLINILYWKLNLFENSQKFHFVCLTCFYSTETYNQKIKIKITFIYMENKVLKCAKYTLHIISHQKTQYSIAIVFFFLTARVSDFFWRNIWLFW